MPGIDGLEATRRIRALPGHRGRTPVVLVTADLIAVDQGESGRTGVDLCLKKPFLRSELLAAVAAAARLTPVPDAVVPNHQVFDDAVFSELSQSLDAASCAGYLDAAVGRIEDLLVLLERPDVAENLTVRDAVHDLIGVTGLLGLGALSSCLRLFDITPDWTTAAALRDTAAAALQGLRRQREPFLAGDGAAPER
jgi:two-component system, sensor histidine kinase and response regulator